jgi:hypothetical protein
MQCQEVSRQNARDGNWRENQPSSLLHILTQLVESYGVTQQSGEQNKDCCEDGESNQHRSNLPKPSQSRPAKDDEPSHESCDKTYEAKSEDSSDDN